MLKWILWRLLARTGRVYGLTSSSAVDVLMAMPAHRRVVLVVTDEE